MSGCCAGPTRKEPPGSRVPDGSSPMLRGPRERAIKPLWIFGTPTAARQRLPLGVAAAPSLDEPGLRDCPVHRPGSASHNADARPPEGRRSARYVNPASDPLGGVDTPARPQP
jgi:hypothetical protein